MQSAHLSERQAMVFHKENGLYVGRDPSSQCWPLVSSVGHWVNRGWVWVDELSQRKLGPLMLASFLTTRQWLAVSALGQTDQGLSPDSVTSS